MQDSEIIERLKNDEFYSIYNFWKQTGNMTTTKHYGILSELYAMLTVTEKLTKGKRLNTSCMGCIEGAMDMIYNRWHL